MAGTFGSSDARSSATVYYDSLLTTTLFAYRKQLVDNIYKDSAFLAYMRMSDAIAHQNGGERIAIPLMYGDNDTIKTHGGYSVIDTTPQEGHTTAFYPWAEIAGTISISRKEQRQNSGESQLINLLKAKIQQAEMTMREKLNTDLIRGTVSSSTFVPDTADDGSYGILPMGYFLRLDCGVDPTTGGDVGNIDASTYSWWRHNVADFSSGSTPSNGKFGISVDSFQDYKIALRRLYNYCSRGTGGAPDLVVFDQLSFESYENSLDAQVRYQNTKMADLGFDTVKLRGATCIWDEQVPDLENGTAAITTGTAFFLNTDFYKIVIDSETDVVTTPFVEPENQTAKTAKILFMGNATMSNLRKMGLAVGITHSSIMS